MRAAPNTQALVEVLERLVMASEAERGKGPLSSQLEDATTMARQFLFNEFGLTSTLAPVVADKATGQRAIFVGCFGTIDRGGQANWPLVRWIKARRREGHRVNLWTSRSIDEAYDLAFKLGIDDLFDQLVPKPTTVVDSTGWRWAAGVPSLGLADIDGMDAKTLAKAKRQGG